MAILATLSVSEDLEMAANRRILKKFFAEKTSLKSESISTNIQFFPVLDKDPSGLKVLAVLNSKEEQLAFKTNHHQYSILNGLEFKKWLPGPELAHHHLSEL